MATNTVVPMSYKIDWLTFGVMPENGPEAEPVIEKVLAQLNYELTDFETISGRYFYNSGLTLGNYFNIFYDDINKEVSKFSARNVLFVFTGQGSTDLAKHLAVTFNNKNWQVIWLDFFRWLKEIKAKVTRIDLALDDYHGVLDFDRMERKLKAGEYRSSKRRYNVIKQLDTAGNVKGRSIYVGQARAKVSKNGSYFVRFYDKYAEYQDKAAVMPREVEDVTTGGGSHVWQRYEIQFNKAKAQNLVNEVLATGSIPEVYRAVMRNIIEFLKKPKKDVNKSRWEVCDWWEQFLDGAGKATLTDPERDLDLGRMLRWIRLAVVPSLHLLQDLGEKRGFDIYHLIKLCEISDYSKKQKRLLNNSIKMPIELINLYLQDFLEGYGKKND